VLLAVVGGRFAFGDRLMKPSQAGHLSIVALPFASLSGDPSQDYFADGITENLTTQLSRIKDSFVIARNTAFTYKGKSVDAKEPKRRKPSGNSQRCCAGTPASRRFGRAFPGKRMSVGNWLVFFAEAPCRHLTCITAIMTIE
jgi:hypothetical protein